MMNQQLVDYIKQQMQAGVSKDAVSKALTDAGWPPVDIADSMKAAEPAAAAGGAAASPAAAQATVNPSVAMGGTDPGPKADFAKPASGAGSGDKFFSKSASMQSVAAVPADDDEDHPSVKKFMAALIAMGAVILLLAGALAFVYFNLNGQLTAAQQAGGGNSAQFTALQAQVAQLTKDKGDLTAQLQPLSAENQELAAEVGFFASAGSGATSTNATVKGTLSGNASTTFSLLTPHNVKIIIANSKDAKVAAALTPLLNSTSTVTLGGTHAPVSVNFTVTSVNGAAL